MITKLKLAISDSGLKQTFIARKIGIDPAVLSKYVTGTRETPVEVIKKISRVLKVPQWNLR
jgi:transcriptional regulator with XRE-family HTH domain